MTTAVDDLMILTIMDTLVEDLADTGLYEGFVWLESDKRAPLSPQVPALIMRSGNELMVGSNLLIPITTHGVLNYLYFLLDNQSKWFWTGPPIWVQPNDPVGVNLPGNTPIPCEQAGGE